MRLIRSNCVAASCCAALLIGCSEQDASFADVQGDVTFCGLPASAEIMFEPLSESGQSDGRPSTDTTDVQGQFRIRFSESKTGAKIGRHRVTIRVLQLPDLPVLAGDAERDTVGPLKITQLQREVRSGGNQFHFCLTP